MLGRFCLAELDLVIYTVYLDFRPCTSILAQRYKGVSGGKREVAGKGGEWGGRWQKLPGEDSHPQMVLTTQLDQRDTIPVEGRIPGWLHPIGVLHRC